jgi:cytoskeletal protein CcmA (bactofilin family)
MWNRETVREDAATEAATTETRRTAVRASTSSTIGANMTIKGELSGTEDLEVFGKIEGNITLQSNTLTLREGGFMQGTIHAKDIEIQGKVHGDLIAKDRVLLKSSANMDGKIVGARVVLEDGCQFKGVIDMEDTARGNMNVIAGGRSSETAANKTKEG